jgi:hypothetical protein
MYGGDVMTEYARKPAQFRFPAWAHEFLAEEASATGTSKTEVLVEALAVLKEQRFNELMAEGYRVCGDIILEEVREWDDTLADGLEDEDW